MNKNLKQFPFRMLFSGILLTLAVLTEIFLTVFFYNPQFSPLLRNTGWVMLWISAFLGWAPILTLKRWGRVPNGKSYIHTSQLVDRGVYGIVRHPQYLAGILLGAALPLIAGRWQAAIPGAAVILSRFATIHEEEQGCLEKFGTAYQEYKRRVPRLNFILGLARWILRTWAAKPPQEDKSS